MSLDSTKLKSSVHGSAKQTKKAAITVKNEKAEAVSLLASQDDLINLESARSGSNFSEGLEPRLEYTEKEIED